MKKIILIDGNNLLFRSYYATAYTGTIMKNSKGFPTNALYGFINMINKILNEEKPEYVMIAFDKGKTFRHDKYETYKDGRKEMPQELKQQFPVAKDLVTAMGIKYFEIDNYEADDIIGTFAKKAEEDKEFDATIISSDKDLLQLINDEIDVRLLKQVGFIRMNKQEFLNTYGIEPIRMIDLKALMGDTSDNIPGVKGIGEKTAISLLKEYGTLQNLYDNIDNIKGKMKEKLLLDKENAFMSYDLATIYREVPIDTDFEKIKYKGIDPLKYVNLLEELEFYSLIKKININEEQINTNIQEKLQIKILDTLDDVDLDEDYAFYLENLGYNYHNSIPIGIGIYNEKCAYYIPFDVLTKYPKFLSSNKNKYTYDLKKSIVTLNRYNIDLKNVTYDAMISGYLLNKNVKDDIAYLMNNCDYKMDFYEEFFGTKNKLKITNMDKTIENIVLKAKFIYETRNLFIDELEQEEAIYLFEQIEMPLCKVLADMELTGIDVNISYLNNMADTLNEKLESIAKEIYEYAGCEFNISSPKQLGDVLFAKMNLPYPKKTKDNSYSTSKEILDKLINVHPIIERIEEYRSLSKIYSVYAIGLAEEVKEDGKIHTIFNQTLTRTGRLSSQEPNLQNIPIRTEEGKLIRKAFIPAKDSLLLSSDYSQIELRIFAHMANVPELINAFNEGKDIHKKTASDIFGVDESMVTSDMRRHAKAVNFGILYGISSFGLGEGLNIDFNQAKKFIDNYMETYPEIKFYMENTIKEAHEFGYVKTIMNRKRNIEELSSKNFLVKSGGERMALNTPIQGSSADILKKAMIEIYDEFNKRGLKSKMVIQVHDELVFNVLKEELDEVESIVRDIMENTYKLKVPLQVDINKGTDWYEAK